MRQGHTRVICINLLEGRNLTKAPGHLRVPSPVKELLTELQSQEREGQYAMSHNFRSNGRYSYKASVQTNPTNATTLVS